MKKLLALILSVCMIFSTFAAVTVFAETENRDIASECTVEAATDGYEDNDAANMFDGKLDTYYMAGKVTDAEGTVLNNTSSNVVWIKLAEHEKITRIETTFGSKADRTTLFGNGGNQNQNFFMYLTDFGPDEGSFDGTNGIVTPAGKTAFRVTNNFSNQSANSTMNVNIAEETAFTYLAIWGPYSSGTCISDLKIFADAEKKEVIPPGAITQLVEKQITPVSAAFTGNQIASADNDANNVIDGQESTMAIVDGYNNHMYIDLGAEYQVTKIEVVYPTEAAITAYLTNVTCDHAASTMNTSTQVRLGTTTPTGTWGNRINGLATVGKSGNVTTYSTDRHASDGAADMNIRYISFTQGTSSNPTAVAEVRVYGMVEVVVDNSNMKNVNVAEGKQVYSNANNAYVAGYPKNMTYEMNAVDGKASTIFAGTTYAINSGDTDINFETVIDLGDAYQITGVKYTPYGGETTSIYGSNSERFDDLEAIASNVATVDNTVQEYEVANKSYRYIVVDRISAEADALLGIRDIEVYAAVQEDDVEAATKYTAGVKVGLNGAVYHTGTVRFGAKEKMNDGIYDHGQDAEKTFVLNATSGTSRYAVMDLGAAYNISAVGLTQALGCSGFNNTALKVIATNDEITESTDLTTVEWTELATGYAYTNVNSKYLLPIEISNDYSFRYVGIKGVSGMGVPFREMDVYASATSYDFGTYTAFASGRDAIVSFSSSEFEGAETVKILVASYDANGALIKLVNDDLDITWNGGGSGSKTLTGAIAEGAVTKKVFILDSLDTLTPLANSITL